jgi:hypothetical protein
MSVTRKGPVTIAADIAALLNLNATAPNVEQLRDLLLSAWGNFLGAIYFHEIDAFITGGSSIKSIATLTLAANEMIFVMIGGKIHHYVLVAGTTSKDISPYVIIPTDYNADTNAKYWLKANCAYVEITNTDVKTGAYEFDHNLGVLYSQPLVISNNDYTVPIVLEAALSGETNCAVLYNSITKTTIKFAGTITGTWKILLMV